MRAVHEMTGQNEDHILNRMGIAEGNLYYAEWWREKLERRELALAPFCKIEPVAVVGLFDGEEGGERV